jgi:glyoxylase-like metal-dependent hydrolase (beta-lactamase superfamily II)
LAGPLAYAARLYHSISATKPSLIRRVLETHVHADHLSGAAWLKQRIGGRIGISEKIVDVQKIVKAMFNLDEVFPVDGSQFDHLFAGDKTLMIGPLSATAMYVPGHTPADLAYRVDDNVVFVGDTLFMPDVGTASCDFPGGDAHQLYESIRRILALSANTRLYMCHDYPPRGRKTAWQSDVATDLEKNIHVRSAIAESSFATMRNARDSELPLPDLFFPAIQANIRGGRVPEEEGNGARYFKLPIVGA